MQILSLFHIFKLGINGESKTVVPLRRDNLHVYLFYIDLGS